MSSRFNPLAFSVVFCIAYAVVFWLNVPLFLYYPQTGAFIWGHTPIPDSGPAMAWYGLMTDAGIAALVVSLVVPNRIAERMTRNRIWLFAVAAMLVCLFLLRALLLH